ncbi:MAG: EamA family transporter [Elusimicrobiota bacterium]|jgi:transporter family protein
MTASTAVFLALFVVCMGAAAILDKIALRYLGGNEVFVVRMGVNALLSLLLFVAGWLPARAAVAQSGKLPVLIITLSLIVTLSGVFCYIKALSGAEASKIIPLSSTYPLITFLLALIFLGEKFTWAKAAGTLLICAGVGLLAL